MSTLSTPLKNAGDKMAALKARREQERALGAQIDQLMRDADATPQGCGVCAIWRRMTRKQRSVVVTAATSESSGAMSTSTQSRLFGIAVKKSDPHAKLAEAAASMEERVVQLESRAASLRAEALRLKGLGNTQAALRMLKKAKAVEKQVEANQAALMAVEAQIDMMAQASMQKQVASALASSSKGMKSNKKMLKNAEAAVDEAQDARDMAEDLGAVMADFAASGNGEDDDELLDELNQMMAEDTKPPVNNSLEEVSLEDAEALAAAAKAAEIAKLESRIADWNEAERLRTQMPAAPSTKLAALKEEKAGLLQAGK